MAQQIAQAAIAFEQRRTGHVPKSVTVVLSEDTLVITLHEALSPAEKALAQSPAGAAQVQEFHRQLFANSCDSLRQEIKRITGVEVREATAEVETGDRHRGAGVHDRHHGAGVPARRQRAGGILERQWVRLGDRQIGEPHVRPRIGRELGRTAGCAPLHHEALESAGEQRHDQGRPRTRKRAPRAGRGRRQGHHQFPVAGW